MSVSKPSSSQEAEDWRKICRICLENKPQLINIFDSFHNFTFSHYINTLADVKISEDDQLPSLICNNCVNELEIVLNFQEKCKKSNKYLQNRLLNKDTNENVKSEVKNEDFNKPVFSVKTELDDSVTTIKEEHYFLEFDGSDCRDSSPILKIEKKVKKEKKVKREKVRKEKSKKDKSRRETGKDSVPAIDKLEKLLKKKLKYKATGLHCAECNKTFLNEAKRKAHWYGVHRMKTYKCDNCLKIFKSLVAFENHVNKGVGCKGRLRGMKIVMEGNTKMYHCTSCEYKKPTRADVWRHCLRHTGEHPYACNLCTKTYTSHKSLSYHKETVHKVYKVEITCHLCGKVVEGHNRFNRHLHRTHPNNKYQCDICKAFLKSKWKLVLHLKSHENLREYVCEACGKPFNTALNLRHHIRNVHEPKKVFDCHLCAYKIKDQKCFKNHIRQHSEDKIQCSICFKFVDSPVKLIRHMESHGEKKHFCLYCNKGFVRRKDCSSHERTRHIVPFTLPILKQLQEPKHSPISE